MNSIDFVTTRIQMTLNNYIFSKPRMGNFGKDKGRANSENKYEFPPPIDNVLYFGNVCVFKSVDDEYVDLTKEEWECTYESLFGGFDDIGHADDEARSVDSEIYSDEEYTKEGYLKDDFIVDDDELVEEEYLSE